MGGGGGGVRLVVPVYFGRLVSRHKICAEIAAKSSSFRERVGA